MTSKCEKCCNAVILKGAYTGTYYLECRLKQEQAENATQEELLYLVKHPEKQRCEYKSGKPKDGGITFDD